MNYRKFFQTCAAAAFSCAAILPLTAPAAGTPGQEVVSNFNYPLQGNVGKLGLGPDGNFYTTVDGGGNGAGGLIKIEPGGHWETFHYFKNLGGLVDGRTPTGGLVSDGQGNLWGVTQGGGSAQSYPGWGTLFKYNVATGAYTIVKDFNITATNTRGVSPIDPPIPDGKGFMWGVTEASFFPSGGSIYKVNIATGEFTFVAQFTGGTTGGNTGDLRGNDLTSRLAGNGGKYLWGVSSYGGTASIGTIYKVDMETGQVSTVIDFGGLTGNLGSLPRGQLKWDGIDSFWGATTQGGDSNQKGTIFKVNAETGKLTTMAIFTGETGRYKGSEPVGNFEMDGQGNLWGFTYRGGSANTGTIFKINPASGLFTTVKEIPNGDAVVAGPMCYDGQGSMVVAGTSIYKINTSNNQATAIMTLGDEGSDKRGRNPYVGLVADSHGLLWGSTQYGGATQNGTVFKVDPLTGKRTPVFDLTGSTGAYPGSFGTTEFASDGRGFMWSSVSGGAYQRGLMFKVDENTHAYTKIADFKDEINGTYPGVVMFDSSGTGWGVTTGDTTHGGTIHRIDPVTGTITTVYRFALTDASSQPSGSALYDDGAGNLWGLALRSNSASYGSIFKFSKADSTVTTLVKFTGTTGAFIGAYPEARLIPDGRGYLWGTTSGTYFGSPAGGGSIYKIRIADGAFTNVAQFSSLTANSYPHGGLTADAQGILWGVTSGDNNQVGCLYRVDPATNAVTIVSGLTGGTRPGAVNLLRYRDGNFYATTNTGGMTDVGTVTRFRMGSTPVTQPAQSITAQGARLQGAITANGYAVNVTFQYGLSPDLSDANSAAALLSAPGATATYTGTLAGLQKGQTYYYRVLVQNPEVQNTQYGNILSFTTLNESSANLTSLSVSGVSLQPAFSSAVTSYHAVVSAPTDRIVITASAVDTNASITIGSVAGSPATVALANGVNHVPVSVLASDGVTTKTYDLTIDRSLPENFTLTGVNSPLTAGALNASGPLNLQLGFAPALGESIKVIDVTQLGFISGQFSTLAQGQEVDLTYNGKVYRYVVNYYGGSGNDLVLELKHAALISWAFPTDNSGHGSVSRSFVDKVDDTGVLAGRTPLASYGGAGMGLVSCSDGTLVTWGRAQLSPDLPPDTDESRVPHTFAPGVLSGKTVVAFAGGQDHLLALASDGTVAAWGSNARSQLGYDSSVKSASSPSAVSGFGSRTPVAIVAGAYFSEVLCSDGAVFGWGDGRGGQLGDDQSRMTPVPGPVKMDGVLSGKKVISLATTTDNTLALCADGTLAAWGMNTFGECGKAPAGRVSTPIEVGHTGALQGKTVVAISGGGSHFLALCSDGSVAAWGSNLNGQLGNGSFSSAAVPIPVQVSRSGVLANRTVVSVRGFPVGSIALCSDGKLVAWGANVNGEISSIGESISTPALIKSAPGFENAPYAKIFGGPVSFVPLSLAALPDGPTAATLGANQIHRDVYFYGSVNAQGSTNVSVSYQYGIDTNYGSSAAAMPASASGFADTLSDAPLTGLIPHTLYHYRIVATPEGGEPVYGADHTFLTFSDNAVLESLELDKGTLTPAFDSVISKYEVTVDSNTAVVWATAASQDPHAQVVVGGALAVTADYRVFLPLHVGNNRFPITVTAEDGVTTKDYELNVVRLPDAFNFTGPLARTLIEVDGFSPVGFSASLNLNFAPPPGTSLTVVRNTGLSRIEGEFSNLAQGQIVTLDYQGARYRFVVNYYGGSGNDLVLEWADTRLAAWGANSYGQAGTGAADKLPVTTPASISGNGTLAGKTVLRTSSGYLHSLALCSDGTIAAWGYNVYGQLGDDTMTQRNEPVQVNATGALAGKTVVAIAAGSFHNLALCSDGTLAAWGYNNSGQLGDGTTASSSTPLKVARTGALAGKTVVGIAAGAYQSYALCSDGTVAAWGYDGEGELGDSGTAVAVTTPVQAGGALAGRKVTALAAGQYHVLALTDNASIIAWGYNKEGQVHGTGSVNVAPVEILPSGVMDGQEVTAIAAGGSHSLALLSNGTIAAWGANSSGQLGNGTTTGTAASGELVAVTSSGALSGKTVAAVSASGTASYAVCSDGTLVAWGANASGQLGSGALSTGSTTPVVVLDPASAAAAPYVMTAGSSSASHGLGLVALPAQVLSATSSGSGSGALAAWRLAHFQTAENVGTAADLADPDQDGVPNLQEYAFGLDPLSAASGPAALPQWHREGDFLVLSFTVPADVTGVTYGAQVSASPAAAAAWTALPDSGADGTHSFRVPLVKGQAGFVRLTVTAP